MPTPSPSQPSGGRGLDRAVQLGMDLLRSAREAARANASTPSRERRMLEEHRLAVARYDSEVRRHHGKVAGLKAAAVAGGTGAVAFGVPALASAGSGGAAEVAVLATMAAGSAAFGVSRLRRARDVQAHPPAPVLPPLPPARLRPGARGAEQADRVAAALLHLYDLIPAVGRLHQPAGSELARAVAQVEPLLRGQVERLASLDRIEWEMPGSRAAQAAVASGGEVAARLRAGADALEDLIAAAARMLAAPDIADGVTDVLSPAIDSLEAFTAGLHAANAARWPTG